MRLRNKDPRQRNLFARALARNTPTKFFETMALPAPVKVTVAIEPSTDETNLNQLERAWLIELRRRGMPAVHIQAMTLKLGHDCRYTPDFMVVTAEGRIEFHETKGPRFWDDAKVKLKVAARLFAWAKFLLIRLDSSTGWIVEEVKP